MRHTGIAISGWRMAELLYCFRLLTVINLVIDLNDPGNSCEEPTSLLTHF